MTQTPRNRISDLYHAALERTAEERHAFLREACGGDNALREEVESLLACEADAAPFLERPAAVVARGGREMLNRQIGPYTIVAPLGSGGMGEVYRARDTKLGRDVAIKILPSAFTADPERRSRFSREARLLATLNHPHIGAIYGLEESDGLTAIVLELVEGPTLADRLDRGPLKIPDALTIARQVAEALEAAHEKGIIHRDLKPANIVLQTASGSAGDVRAKVLDFGLAKAMGGDLGREAPPSSFESISGTADGRILGTPVYMSPEQTRAETVDKRTDIWAFGCVLFEMLSGRRPFDGKTVTETFAHVLEREPEWSALPRETPASIRTLLQRCLEKNPQKRLHDIADARIELDDAHRTSGPDNRGAASGVRRSRESLPWFVAAAFAVIACAMAVLYVRDVPPAVAPIEFTVSPPDGWYFRTEVTPGTLEVAPDGQHVVAVAFLEGDSTLWIRPIASPSWRQLPETRNAFSPFWSPDSQSVGFFANNQLKTVRVSGGSPVVICSLPGGQGPTGAWSPAGVLLFSTDRLWKVGVTGGSPTPVTALANDDLAHRHPAFLPDGDHFLYLAQTDSMNELRIGSLTSNDTASLEQFDSNARYANDHLVLVRGGRLMAQRFDPRARQFNGPPQLLADQTGVNVPGMRGLFSLSATGVLAYGRAGRPLLQLTWFDRSGKALGTVGEAGFYHNLDLSPDGNRVAVSRTTQPAGLPWNTDIWVIDLERAGPGTRLTVDPAREHDPAWSPDGSEIAFNSNRIGRRFGLFKRPSSPSGEDELLVESSTAISYPDWSPNGRVLTYSEGRPEGGVNRNDLWMLPISGERKPSVFYDTKYFEQQPTFSPDGHWVAFGSDQPGRSEIHVRPFSSKAEVPPPVSLHGGRAPRWRDDGREIFFLAPDGTLMSAAVTETATRFHASVPKSLFKTSLLAEYLTGNPYVVSKDGQRFLIPVPTTSPDRDTRNVVLNWPALLRK